MKISVIIPFYNLEPYVRKCLDSVVGAIREMERCGEAGQRMASHFLEVICVDDGSTDETPRFLDSYASTLDLLPSVFNLRIIHKQNGGEGSARNAGLAAATGDWVTFLDGDDLWHKAMLISFLEVAARHPDADIVGFRFAPFDDSDAVSCPPSATISEAEYVTRDTIPAVAVLELGVFPTFFRREVFSSLSFSALPLGADRLYVAQCLALSNRLVMSSRVLHAYRVREGSMARAEWNARKIRSMVDFAAGSLKALIGSGKRLEVGGTAYLWDVLLKVTPKQLGRMREGSSEVRHYWLSVLTASDAVGLTLWQRVRRFVLLRAHR